jgi:hypothetical protein
MPPYEVAQLVDIGRIYFERLSVLYARHLDRRAA